MCVCVNCMYVYVRVYVLSCIIIIIIIIIVYFFFLDVKIAGQKPSSLQDQRVCKFYNSKNRHISDAMSVCL